MLATVGNSWSCWRENTHLQEMKWEPQHRELG
ncbi:unnamed protein product [Gulo gulo]|uniref:Uncharacterized protein n=1 Tax=Gulo gulo TaxID=48420 RepID=A0A9X9LMG6_GULGU|nr:unnamed protein product [Gulo gulo]